MPFIKVKGKHFEVVLGADFRHAVKLDNDFISGDSVEQLRSKIARKLTETSDRLKIQIAHQIDRGHPYQRMIMRGKHGRNYNAYLVQFADGTKGNISGEPVIKGSDITDEQIETLNALVKAVVDAEQRLSAAQRQFTKVQMSRLIDEAVANYEEPTAP